MSFGSGGNLGTAVLELSADSSKLERGLRDAERTTQRSSRRMGQSISDVGKSMTGIGTKMTAGVTLPIIGAGAAMFKFAADAQTAGRRLGTTFGGEVGRINGFLEDLQDIAPASMATLQNSASDAMGTLVTLGVESGKSANMTEEVMEVAANLAAHMDMDFSEALDKVNKGYMGQTDGLQSMAYNINQALIETRALELGLVAEGDAVTGAARAQAVHSIVMEQSAGIMDAANEQSDTFNFQMRRMWATVQDAGAAIMKDLLPPITRAVSWISGIVGRFKELSDSTRRWILIIGGIVAAVGPVLLILGLLLSVFGALLSPIGLVAAAIVGLVTLFATDFLGIRTTVINVFRSLEDKFGSIRDTVTTFKEALSGDWVDDSGIQPLHRAVGLLGSGLRDLYDAWQDGGISGLLSELRDQLSGLASTALNALSNVDWGEVAGAIWGGISKAVTTVALAGAGLATALYDWIVDAIEGIDWAGIAESFGGFISGLWGAVTGGAVAAYNWIHDTIEGIDWDELGTAFGEWLLELWSGISTAVTDAYNWIHDTITGIDWDKIGASLNESLQDAWNQVSLATTQFYDWMQDTVDEADWNAIGDSIGDWLQSAWDGIDAATERFDTWLRDSIGAPESGAILSADMYFKLLNMIENTDWEGLGTRVGEFIVDLITSAFSGDDAATSEEGESLGIRILKGFAAALVAGGKLYIAVNMALIEFFAGLALALVQPLIDWGKGLVEDFVGGFNDRLAALEAKNQELKDAVGQWFIDLKDSVLLLVDDLVRGVVGFFTDLRDDGSALVGELRDRAMARLDDLLIKVREMQTKLLDAILWPFREARDNIGAIATAIGNRFLGPVRTMLGYFQTFIHGIRDAVNWASGKLGMGDVISGSWTVPNIDRLHSGTRNWRGGPAIIKDEELVVLPKGADVYNPSETRAVMAGIDSYGFPGMRAKMGGQTPNIGGPFEWGKEQFEGVVEWGSDLYGQVADWVAKGATWVAEQAFSAVGVPSLNLSGVWEQIGDVIFSKIHEGVREVIRGLVGKAEESLEDEPVASSTHDGPVPGIAGWVRPTSGGITQGYGRTPFSHNYAGNFHTGIDYGGGFGAPIRAANAGVVAGAGYSGGFGLRAILAHANNLATLYGHMQRILVGVGQTVGAGQQIGEMGSTGFSTGPHLHFETWEGGRPVYPGRYVPLAEGGWINEPVAGLGLRTGTRYMMGEEGSELITPKDKVGGTGDTRIVVNVNPGAVQVTGPGDTDLGERIGNAVARVIEEVTMSGSESRPGSPSRLPGVS